MASNANSSATNQQITLVGCLHGPSSAAATGTSGARDRSSAARSDIGRDVGTGSAYRLVDAAPASKDSAGIGSNGAGASGGPLASGRATYLLDGIPDRARGDVNKQVRVVGRLDAMSAPGDGAPTDRAGSAAPAGTDRRIRVDGVEVMAQNCPQR